AEAARFDAEVRSVRQLRPRSAPVCCNKKAEQETRVGRCVGDRSIDCSGSPEGTLRISERDPSHIRSWEAPRKLSPMGPGICGFPDAVIGSAGRKNIPQ